VAAISIAGPVIATSDLIMNLAQSAGVMDPIMAIGLPTIAMGGVGWLAGPLLGNLVFSLRVGKESLKDMAAVRSSHGRGHSDRRIQYMDMTAQEGLGEEIHSSVHLKQRYTWNTC
jgi:hypothetical protein